MPRADAPDRLFGGRLLLRQDARGHRAGTDAVLLAAAAPATLRGLIVDLGAGSGAVGLRLAQRWQDARVILVDDDATALALARENVGLNRVADRVAVVQADILADAPTRRAAGLPWNEAALVVTNPPFGSASAMRPSPDAARAAAHIMPEGGLARWLAAAADMLATRGALVMIHRADALAEALDALAGRFGSVVVKAAHPRHDAPASRVLIRAAKGGRGPLTLAPALILHEDDGRFTNTAEAIHRGEAGIDF